MSVTITQHKDFLELIDTETERLYKITEKDGAPLVETYFRGKRHAADDAGQDEPGAPEPAQGQDPAAPTDDADETVILGLHFRAAKA